MIRIQANRDRVKTIADIAHGECFWIGGRIYMVTRLETTSVGYVGCLRFASGRIEWLTYDTVVVPADVYLRIGE